MGKRHAMVVLVARDARLLALSIGFRSFLFKHWMKNLRGCRFDHGQYRPNA